LAIVADARRLSPTQPDFKAKSPPSETTMGVANQIGTTGRQLNFFVADVEGWEADLRWRLDDGKSREIA
jgi:hypothetical protein